MFQTTNQYTIINPNYYINNEFDQDQTVQPQKELFPRSLQASAWDSLQTSSANRSFPNFLWKTTTNSGLSFRKTWRLFCGNETYPLVILHSENGKIVHKYGPFTVLPTYLIHIYLLKRHFYMDTPLNNQGVLF